MVQFSQAVADPLIESNQLKSLFVQFNLPLRPAQIPQWRGAVAASVGWQENHFHNHLHGETDRYAYRYPLIQYRCTAGRAGLWSMGAGVDSLQGWVMSGRLAVKIGKQTKVLGIEHLLESRDELCLLPEMRTYRIIDYLPLNQSNYQEWLKLGALGDRVVLLERILAGHLLGFASAANYWIAGRLEAELLSIERMGRVGVHGHERIAFDLLFRTNLLLPARAAIGRSVAFGFGVLSGR